MFETQMLSKETTMVRSSDFLYVSALRNCFRCGKEFRTHDKQRICVACRKPPEPKPCVNRTLSFREKQIVKLVQQAKLNKEIAYELHLSEGTIKEYLNRIFRKLGVKNRTELAIWGFMHADAA
jgi:DNA-binding NarL/FixJ family response regulator